MNTEKKGKFLSFLKAKAKPIQPRKKKSTFELKATLQNYKRRKIEESPDKNVEVDIYGNVSLKEGD